MTTRPFTVVPPVAMTDAMLISTDVPEADYPAWDVGTTYAAGTRVIVAAKHTVYESVAAGNLGHDPVADVAGAYWLTVGPTNRWAIFDGKHSSATAQATAISYRLRPGVAVSCVAALALTGATSLRVRLVDATYGTVYDRLVDLSPLPPTSDWYAWYFSLRTAPGLKLFLDLPAFPSADILVDFTGGPSLSVGVLSFGQARSIGLCVQQGARVGLQDYSKVETNDFGDVVVVERAVAKRATFTVPMLRADVDATLRFLGDMRTTPALYIGSDRYESTVIYGIYQNLDVLINYAELSECSLAIRGLT
jgi:hypothetical protein